MSMSHDGEQPPFVSVVIPTCGRPELLRRCLKSLFTQDYPHDRYEIVVVDDGPTDTARAVVESFGDRDIAVKYSRTQSTGTNGSHGPNAARNVGVRVASGRLLGFLDDDIICPPSWLSRIVAESGGAADLVYGPVQLTPGIHLPSRHGEESALLADSPAPPIPMFGNMLVHRGVFDRDYPSEHWYPPVEEIEWLRRVQPITRFAPGAIVIHHKTSEDVRVSRLARAAWLRGRESGRYARRVDGKRADEIVRAAASCLRAIGHTVIARCWGGMFVALGRAGFVYGWLRG